MKIYFANHRSHLDYPLLRAFLPRHTRPVAAVDYWCANPLRRFFAVTVFGAVLIERRALDRDPLAPLLAALDRGQSLLLFPEGTRGDGPKVQPFRSGIYHLARQRPHIPLAPIRIRYHWPTFLPETQLRENELKQEFLSRLESYVA